MTVRGYQLAIDWSRSGVYTGTLEDVTVPGATYVQSETDIVATWGRGAVRATDDATNGRLTFALVNIDRQFSPENTSSPIAGKVLPGTSVRLNVTDPVGGGITTVFQGPIDILDVDPNAAGKDFTAECSDGWGLPGDTQLSTPVYQGQRTGDLMNIILDAIGWPAAARSIDPGATLVPYWWAEGVDAATAVNDLVHSEGPPAIAYVQKGIFYFRDRHHRLVAARSTTSQGTYTHTIPAGAVPGDHKILSGSFGYNHGLANIVNAATLEVTPRIPQNVQVVWKTDDPISLGANETRTIVARTDDPFILAQVPSALIVYIEDGTFTRDYHVAAGTVTVTLSRDSGQSLLITLTAGAGGVLLDEGLKLRATPLTAGATYKFSEEDPSSVNTFGRNTWGGTAPWAYLYDADVITQRIVAVYAQARPSVTFEIEGVLGSATFTEILGQLISDRITVRNDELGLTADFMVEQLSHTIQKLGVRHTLRIGAEVVEPQQPSNVFTFDLAGSGFNDGKFGVAGVTDPSTMFTFDVAGKGFNDGRFAA